MYGKKFFECLCRSSRRSSPRLIIDINNETSAHISVHSASITN